MIPPCKIIVWIFWKTLHNWIHGIVAQQEVCKHTNKMMLWKRSSAIMSGGPSLVSICLSMLTSGHLSVIMPGYPSVMPVRPPNPPMKWSVCPIMSGCLSATMFGRLSVWLLIYFMKIKENCNGKAFFTGSPEYGPRCKQDVWVTEDCNAVTVSETSPPKTYTGLENQGATCYLNTVLQILFMTEDFRKMVERYPKNNSTISYHIAQLFEHLKLGQRTTATTEGITADLKINVHKQEDAANCLQKILNLVEPEVSEMFQGIQEDTTICKNPPKHHHPLKQVKSFFIISISLESKAQIYLQSCFNSYFEPINMCEEDEQIYCNDCQMMMETEISCSLLKVPSVLVLQLERFELDYDTYCCVKNNSSVQIPAQLLVKEKTDTNHKYDLYALANHFGSLSSGHYYADIKSFEDQQWYRFDDSSVQNVNQKFDLDNPLSSDEAYLLFYKKSASETVFSDNKT